MYSKKFDEFQGTVSKSNSVYSGFKQDMDKVGLLLNIYFHYCLYWLFLIRKTIIREKKAMRFTKTFKKEKKK